MKAIWIPSYGKKVHIRDSNGWYLCGKGRVDKDPVDEPPENKKCRSCVKAFKRLV